MNQNIMEQQTVSSVSLSSLSIKRPKLITIVCIFGFVIMSPFLFMLYINLENFYLIGIRWIIPFIILFGFVGLVGYWKMRKWGVYVYTAMAIISISYMLVRGSPDIYIHIFSLLIVGAGFANLKKMV